jgi:NTE family protein
MDKKRVSLVLGSGGARGYAHIGVIEELERNGYEICAISGSSMGALIGGLYACGKLQEYKEWVLGLDLIDVAKLLDFTFAGNGFIEGERVFEQLGSMIGKIYIEDLPIAYTAVASDLLRQKEVWLQRGSLLDAIRASISIPTLFTPKEIDGRFLVDGGLLNPLPIAPTLSNSCDLTIAVSLNDLKNSIPKIALPKKEEEQKYIFEDWIDGIKNRALELIARERKSDIKDMGVFDIIGRSIDTMQNAIEECKMSGYTPDLLIGIPKESCGFYEFHRAYELIEIGRFLTKESLNSK